MAGRLLHLSHNFLFSMSVQRPDTHLEHSFNLLALSAEVRPCGPGSLSRPETEDPRDHMGKDDFFRARAALRERLEDRVESDEVASPEPAREERLSDLGLAETNRYGRILPLLLVALAIAFNLWMLRGERLPVADPSDNALHESMVDWARQRIVEGHLPFDGWYPNLGLGSAQFHHYQSLPHIITGTLAVVLGSERAFRWSLYLLLAAWPLCIYWSGRLLGWGRRPAVLAAVVAPLLVSTPGYGYEFGSYVWRGWGMWSQLWGMWLLPLSLALSWRAISGKGSLALAALALALTLACHFMTGYLALLSIGVLAVLTPSEGLKRIRRAVVVGIGGALTAAWVIVPVLVDRRWILQDDLYKGTSYVDSYGARRVLGWLFSGGIYDGGRLPVVSLLVAIGAGVCVARFRRDERARVLLSFFALSLALFFGRPTLGPLLNAIPGSHELYLHRYIMGVHLAGIFMAGVGAAWLGKVILASIRRLVPTVRPVQAAGLLALLGIAFVAPAWAERAAYLGQGRDWIAQQRRADATDGPAVAALVERARLMGPGRIYAGPRGHWGDAREVGQVPVYTYLLQQDADSVGFTRRTASLSSAVEARFDDTDPVQYDMLGIRYVILTTDQSPRVPATLVEQQGRYALWSLQTGGYMTIVDTGPPLRADRTDLGQVDESFLHSDLAAEGIYPLVAFGGQATVSPLPPPLAPGSGPPGTVLEESDSPIDGRFAATFVTYRPAVMMVKTSFDPRWKIELDGVEVPPQMVAPSFVGAVVPAGRHEISFVYEPYPYYGVLFGVGALTLLLLLLAPRLRLPLTARRASVRNPA